AEGPVHHVTRDPDHNHQVDHARGVRVHKPHNGVGTHQLTHEEHQTEKYRGDRAGHPHQAPPPGPHPHRPPPRPGRRAKTAAQAPAYNVTPDRHLYQQHDHARGERVLKPLKAVGTLQLTH
ncbi:hypothetical protein PUR58_26890, partial [Streptomyces sp. JV186]|nr:hypothetical protein [Streptomyces sp. JV186]